MMQMTGKYLGGILWACFSLSLAGSLVADEPAGVAGWLRLYGDDHLAGTLEDSLPESPGAFAWRHPLFDGAFEFNLDCVRCAAFPPIKLPAVAGELFMVELIDGNRVIGQITGADEQTVQLKTAGMNEVTVQRRVIDRISRHNQDDDSYFVGPAGLNNWTSEADKSDWQDRGGQLSTKKEGASLFRDGVLLDRCRIEIELTWNNYPNFVLALGVDDEDIESSTKAAFRLEVWEEQVVLLRETDDAADVMPLGNVDDLDGLLKIQFDLDQTTGTILARTDSSGTDTRLKISAEDRDKIRTGIRLINLGGTISLDSLQVMPLQQSDEASTADTDAGTDTFVLSDDSTRRGQWTEIQDGRWIVKDQDTEHRIDPSSIVRVQLARMEEDQGEEPDEDGEKDSESILRIITHSGSQLSGIWRGVSDGRLRLDVKSLAEPALILTKHINRINAISSAQTTSASLSFINVGRLEIPDGQLTGRLVATPPDTNSSPLRFQAKGSAVVTMSDRFAGCLVYREPPPPETLAQRKAREASERRTRLLAERRAARGPKPNLDLMNVFNRAFGNNAQTRSRKTKSMHLRSGEIIPCEVESIDQQGVVFKSELTDQTRLPHDQVRAVQLDSEWGTPSLAPPEQERFLTVPRIGKNRPPTHLMIAKNGDLLRCRLIRLTDKIAQVETRMETIEIDRLLIAQIVWLNAPSTELSENGTDEPDDQVLRVRARMRNGNQISLIPQRVSETEIFGSHPYLGNAVITLDDADELVFGAFVSKADAQQPYRQWALRDAPEPMIAGDGDTGGRPPGRASVLVGKPAPDFTLDLLGGGRIQVSRLQGKVLVLDFWATWCGPCLQAMPVIDKTVSRFDEAEVMLVAVNLQETAEPIRKTLQRLNISPQVALDIDGVAAARYQADAIPQTVVIDRQGQIARVFIGSGGDLAEQLGDAIEEQLAKDP
jgi:thiol-disulfide isomerase/thioredoxin